MDEDQPVYVVSGDTIELQKKPEAKREEKSPYLLGSPLLSFSLFLALLAYFLDAGDWMKAAEAYVAGKNKAAAIQPYRDWAAKNPIGYDEVFASPDAWTGKAVKWRVIASPAGNFFYEGDGMKPVRWTDESPVRAAIGAADRGDFLGRVEGERQSAPLLLYLEGR